MSNGKCIIVGMCPYVSDVNEAIDCTGCDYFEEFDDDSDFFEEDDWKWLK